MMNVLLADDHRLMLEGLRSALSAAKDIKVVGEAKEGSQVPPMVGELRPDVVLLDIRLPKLDGLACLERLRKQYPDVKVVMLSVCSDSENIEAALKKGACGYIVKTINPRDLPAALRQIVHGTMFHVLGEPERNELREAQEAGLTTREIAILGGVARGLSNRALGRELWVTEQTVKFHLTNIYRKLQVANRTEAARAAYQLGIVESPVLEEAL